jgi:hypothetical protein
VDGFPFLEWDLNEGGREAAETVRHEAGFGHKPPFTCVVGRTFRRRLRPVTGHPIVKDERSFSAIADIGESWVLRQQWGGLLTVAASSSRTAASCISELTLPTL